MLLIRTAQQLQQYLRHQQQQGRAVAFVPTMGALHKGHLSLIQQAAHLAPCVVCSIYVNPTQFNDPADLNRYPRTLATDLQQLALTPCEVVFAPDTTEVYPDGLDNHLKLQVGHLAEVMEGQHRPGHFAGMLQVVHRLLTLVQPQYLLMGQKDYQQYALVRYMIEQLQLPVHLVCCPIVREPDGLAMSSRNVHLSPGGRERAPILYRSLVQLSQQATHTPLPALVEAALHQLHLADIQVDYLEVVDAHTLLPVQHLHQADSVIACATIRIDNIRLLDNVFLKPAEPTSGAA